jgi:hypothetical protein
VAIGEVLEREVKTEIGRFENMFAPNVDAVKRGKMWSVRAEVVGPRVLAPTEVALIEKRVSKATGQEMSLHAWCRIELIVTGSRFISIEDFTKELIEKREKKEELN